MEIRTMTWSSRATSIVSLSKQAAISQHQQHTPPFRLAGHSNRPICLQESLSVPLQQLLLLIAHGWDLLHTAPLEAIEATVMHVLSLQQGICHLLLQHRVPQPLPAEVHLGTLQLQIATVT
jgi:hypothetical protein